MEQQNEDIISIDFKALFTIIKRELKRIIIVALLFIIVGGIYAFSLKNEFTSEGKILPELSSKSNKLGGLSSLSGLAGLAGVNLDNLGTTEAIRPDLYPDIVNNTPFYLHILKQKITTKEGSIMTFEGYLKKEATSTSWLSNLFSGDSTKKLVFIAPKDSNIISLTEKQFTTIENLQKRIGASYDKKTGVISISVKMPDPVVAAVVARLTMNYITEYVSKYRTEKARQDLVFLQDRVREARGRYYGEQSRKAQYTDQSKFIAVQAADLQRERIESDYKVSTSVYNNLMAQLEQAKIKVQEETPVLQVLNPPQVPLKKSEPKRSILLIIYAFLGGMTGVIWAILRKRNYKEIIKS
jgi:uncharacterized protein involved in exopolysaccharide biosynthesis